MRKMFDIPEMEITYFDSNDVIRTSGIAGSKISIDQINPENMSVMTLDVKEDLGFTF